MSAVTIPARILGTGSHLAGRRVSTRELCLRAMPERDPDRMQTRIGISNRYWVEPGTSAAEIGAAALRLALTDAKLEASALRRIIFVSSTGGDLLIPGTGHMVCQQLGLDDSCDALDLNNSCAGFLTALDLASRSVATGLGPVAIVVAEIFSRYLPPEHPRPYLVMGDAAAAVIVGAGGPDEGLIATYLRSSVDMRMQIEMAHPGLSGVAPHLQFDANYQQLTDSAVRALRGSSRAVLRAAGLDLDAIEWFLPHQPNGRMLDIILDLMEVPPERSFSVVEGIGSVGAASIPVSLDRLLRSGRVTPGDHILMTAVGAGTGYGALLLRSGPTRSHDDTPDPDPVPAHLALDP